MSKENKDTKSKCCEAKIRKSWNGYLWCTNCDKEVSKQEQVNNCDGCEKGKRIEVIKSENLHWDSEMGFSRCTKDRYSQEQPKECDHKTVQGLVGGKWVCSDCKKVTGVEIPSLPKEECCRKCYGTKNYCAITTCSCHSPSQPNEQEQAIEEIMDCVSGDNISYHAGKIRGILQELSASARSQERAKLKEILVSEIGASAMGITKNKSTLDVLKSLLDYLNTEK